MVKALAVVLLVVLMGAAAQAQAPPTPETRAALNAMLDGLVAAAKKCDAGAFAAHMSSTAFVGAFEVEGQLYVVGRDEFTETLAGYWANGTTKAASLDDRKIQINGQVAVVSGRFRHDASTYPAPIEAEMRLLAVREGDQWKVLCAAIAVDAVPVADPNNAQVKEARATLEQWNSAFAKADAKPLRDCISKTAFAAWVDLPLQQFTFANREELLGMLDQVLPSTPPQVSEIKDVQTTVLGGLAMGTMHWTLGIPDLGQIEVQVSFVLAHPEGKWEIVAAIVGPWVKPEAEPGK